METITTNVTTPKTLYRFIQHTIDDDLNNEIQSRADRGWIILKAFEPIKFRESDDYFIGIIWQKTEFVTSIEKQ